MKPATTRRLAWWVGGTSILLMAGSLGFMFLDRAAVFPANVGNRWGVAPILDVVANIGVPVLAIVILSRRPRHTIGWIFLVAGVFLAIQNFAQCYGLHALFADPGSLPGALFAGWLTNMSWPIPISLLVFLLLLFPTGSLPSARWRPFAGAAATLYILLFVSSVIFASLAWSKPFSVDVPSTESALDRVATIVFTAGALGVAGGMLMAFVALGLRFRRAHGEERLQLKWFVTATAFVFIAYTLTFFGNTTWASLAFSIALLSLYAAIGIAIVRYRLYEIDVFISKAVVFGSIAAFITIVYVGIVVGVGAIVGDRQSPLLSGIAAAVVAIAFQPVRRGAQRLANRLVYGERATPYEVLSEFSERAAATYSTEDVLPRMVQILSAGTGATEACVWLRVGTELRPAASWPSNGAVAPVRIADDELPEFAPRVHAFPVRHGGELLGAITAVMPPSDPLTPDQQRLLNDVAAQTGLVLRNVRLIEELRASRRRIVTAQDARAKALERNIHDGAQQQLVAMAVKLRLAEQMTERDTSKAREILGQLQVEATETLENLRDLARGIYPPLLADQGLAAALESQARKVPLPVVIEADARLRFAPEVEAAVYFCCLEALQNVTKYANASRATVRITSGHGELRVEVEDDGSGFDQAVTHAGTGIQGMTDRMDALGGSLLVESERGRGTRIVGTVPAEAIAPGS
ncbi:MAG TPA: histidine kinase [Actinomycetota bacterium]